MQILLTTRFSKLLLAGVFLTALRAAGGSWHTNAPMNFVRRAHTATLLPNGKVLVAGGQGIIAGQETTITNAELYDPAAGTWQVTGSLTDGRSFHTATLLGNGKVLVAGGIGVSSAELYDPTTAVWTLTGSMSTARYRHTASRLSNGKVLVTGGIDAIGNFTASAEVYDPAVGTWTAVGSMNSTRWAHEATVLANGKVLVTGGATNNGGNLIVLSSAELFDPAGGTFSNTASMSAGRFDHTSTLLPNGKVLVTGGFDNANSISSTEIYDPVISTWTNSGALMVARDTPTTTLLPNGNLLTAGGYNGGSYLSSAEIFNSASGNWTMESAMTQPRWQHTASLLASGDVLVTGGYDGTMLLASTESYVSTSQPPILTGAKTLDNGAFQFSFSSPTGTSFNALATTNLLLPSSNWTVLGTVPEISPGQFQFTDLAATNRPMRYYRVRSP